MRRNKMSVRRVVGLMAVAGLAMCAMGGGVPDNLDFERGDLSGWTGDGHWCVVTPDAAFAAPRVSVHGMFSAVAKSERGEAVVQSYEKSATYQGPRVLVSPPLEVSDRYLVLSLAGAPMKGGKGVSAELLDADGRPCAAPFVRGPAFAAFDVSALRGRTVRLRVTAVEAAAALACASATAANTDSGSPPTPMPPETTASSMSTRAFNRKSAENERMIAATVCCIVI